MNDIQRAGITCDDMHYDFLRNEYERLPASIKMIYTPKEWLWLGADERGRAVERETMPDGPPE